MIKYERMKHAKEWAMGVSSSAVLTAGAERFIEKALYNGEDVFGSEWVWALAGGIGIPAIGLFVAWCFKTARKSARKAQTTA